MSALPRSWTGLAEALTCSFLPPYVARSSSSKSLSFLPRRYLIDYSCCSESRGRSRWGPFAPRPRSGLDSWTSAIVKTMTDGGRHPGPDVGWRNFMVGMYDRRLTVSRYYPVLHILHYFASYRWRSAYGRRPDPTPNPKPNPIKQNKLLQLLWDRGVRRNSSL